jgi:hydroxyacylglutathione hydrolase
MSLHSNSAMLNFAARTQKVNTMKVEQIYTGCLAHGAYYIVSGKEAAIVDPLREVQPYLDRLAADGVQLKYILETHFHADFVSGHLDLARATGAEIVYGPTAKPAFPALVAEDGQSLPLGAVQIKVLHTPGHTMESSTFLLVDEAGRDHAIFSGDTLFIGDVGRPDLAQKAANMTKEQLATLLYHSLRDKVMTLADEVIVYPGHGAGSACGKNMSSETTSTVGLQKKLNYALRANMTEAEFVQEVTEGLLPPPGYFPANVQMNKFGYEAIDKVLRMGMQPLSPAAFEAGAEALDALILDTRDADVFAKGFIPRAINIGLNGDFAPWVGALIVDVKQPILVVAEPGTEEQVIVRLSRVGFDNVLGHLAGGFPAWAQAGKEIDQIDRLSPEAFAERVRMGEDLVLDLRKESEYAAEHLDGAFSRPLAYLNDWIKDLQPNQHYYLHCAGGYRSMIAASILQARGYRNFTEVEGGFKALSNTALPRTNYVCQSKILK